MASQETIITVIGELAKIGDHAELGKRDEGPVAEFEVDGTLCTFSRDRDGKTYYWCVAIDGEEEEAYDEYADAVSAFKSAVRSELAAQYYSHTDLLSKQFAALLKQALDRANSYPSGSSESSAAQREVEKYRALTQRNGDFREPYNPASIFSRLGLSWWADVIPLCTPNGKLEGKNLRKLHRMVAHAPLQMPTLEELKTLKMLGLVGKKMDLEECEDYVKAQHKEILAFLTHIIRRQGAMYCTLDPAPGTAAVAQEIEQQGAVVGSTACVPRLTLQTLQF